MEKQYPENFQIVKDPEKELYYAITKFPYDSENEFSIFAHGNSKEEANNNAITTILNCLNECLNTLNTIFKEISYEKYTSFHEKLYLPYHHIPEQLITENYTCESFDALGYDEKDKQWYRIYR